MFTLEPFIQLLHGRHLIPAGGTPGGPYIDENHFGIVKLEAGTTDSGYSYLAANDQTWSNYTLTSSIVLTCEWLVRTDTLSDATNSYSIYFGLSTSNVANTSIMFHYTHSTNSGNWSLRCADSGSATESDSSVAVAANTWYHLKIVATAAAVKFYVDEVLVGTVAANITSSAMSPTVFIGKSAGTTNRSTWVDTCRMRAEFPDGRV